MIVIQNISIDAPENSGNYDENVMWAGQAYEYLYNHFSKNISEVQRLLPALAKYYEVNRRDIIKEWCEQYAVLKI